ncbi:hypothetical protein [Streptomyces sp. NBC_01190]|uniref:hypothetical protein n=1 Tax=Streptomyces sp. NBC_01190 TaxID=2903767 RepID=UPI00386D58D5|nr:hypothetical protein OG519_14235 [Streptomyces sp. NBC_01190]
MERRADWQASGAGLYLLANAVRALAEFDVSRIWGHGGDCLAIGRNDLHEVLCTATGGTEVRFNAEVTGVDADGTVTFADFAGPVAELLEQGAVAYFAALYESVGADWTRPHTVLVGDAAHACFPSATKGGAMALEDAVVLQELLGESEKQEVGGGTGEGDRFTAALAAFQARRVDRVQWVLDQNHRRDKARDLPTPLGNLTLQCAGERLFETTHAPLHTQP